MEQFIVGTKKSFVTISGGGDPLFNIDVEPDNLNTLVKILKLIKSAGKSTRIITREVSKIHLIPVELVDHISLSVDDIVLKDLGKIVLPLDISYELTLVSPPNADEKSLEKFLNRVLIIKRAYNIPVTVRQNVNNLIDPSQDKLLPMAVKKNIKVVTSDLCLHKSKYFINDTVYTGYETTPNFREELLKFTGLNPTSIVFGSAVRNYVRGNRFPYFKDIDLAVDVNTFILPVGYKLLRSEKHEKRTINLYQNIKFKEIMFHVIMSDSPANFVGSFQINLDTYGLRNVNGDMVVFNAATHKDARAEYESVIDSTQLIMSRKWKTAPNFNKHVKKLMSHGYEILDQII